MIGRVQYASDHVPCASASARLQISPGIAHPSSRLCASDLRHRVPYMYWASHAFACSPHGAASIRFLFVAPALCLELPSDSRSPGNPLPSANTCPCRLCRGLPPPSECALPGAQKKGGLFSPPSILRQPLPRRSELDSEIQHQHPRTQRVFSLDELTRGRVGAGRIIEQVAAVRRHRPVVLGHTD
jgi:hypothetical protein